MTEKQIRQQVLDKAKEYLGCKKGDPKIYALYDLYNEHLAESVARWGTRNCKMLRSYDGYCAVFVSAIQIMFGNQDIQPMEIAPYEMVANIAKKKGLWQPYGSGYAPQPGDNILFDWDGKRAAADHIGFVYSFDGNIVTTLEGNATGGETLIRTFQKDDPSIMGYINPNYASKATASEPTIISAEATDVTCDGYTVKCEFSAPEGVKQVLMPTWTENNAQDDLVWHRATVVGNKASFKVTTAMHKNEHGKYITHVYVYDKTGAYTTKEVRVTVPAKEEKTWEEKIVDMVKKMKDGDELLRVGQDEYVLKHITKETIKIE